MKLQKYSLGVGDRFAHQAKAQLEAIIEAKKDGVDIVPVWNKSYREHTTIKTQPLSVRQAADEAVKSLNWEGAYYCDADHIGLNNVEQFIDVCDFFTLDVADFLGKPADKLQIDAFAASKSNLVGKLIIPGIDESFDVDRAKISQIASKILSAVSQAAKIYRKIVAIKGEGNFVTEVSMDETDISQSPIELLFILAALADEGVPVQTIAPKFSGRFNKGVDYVGAVELFEKEFEQDTAVIRYALKNFNLPSNLKLSVHSGSDKFSIYPAINRVIKNYDCGVHIKTAGTTWLEEIIGLAESGSDALDMAKLIYKSAYERYDELCLPYCSVIDIDKSALPLPLEVDEYTDQDFAQALRHDSENPTYNPNMRQLIHVGYKIAAEKGEEYTAILEANANTISKCVIDNILERHIKRIFY